MAGKAFGVIEVEESVQVRDKFRISLAKSFVPTNETAIDQVRVTPGLDENQYDISPTVSKDQFLDWEYWLWTFDFEKDLNDKIDIEIDGILVTVSFGSINFQSLNDLVGYLLAVIGSSGLTGVTISVSNDNRLTISADQSFKLLPETGPNKNIQMLKHLGFRYDTGYSNSQTGYPVEYGQKKILADIGSPSGYDQTYKFINLYSKEGDRLFCENDDLRKHESDILKWVEDGRTSFLNVIRRSQQLIIEDFNKSGWTDISGKPLTKWSFDITENLRDWSIYQSLSIIFDDISNAVDDTFFKQARIYDGKSKEAKARFIAVDFSSKGDNKNPNLKSESVALNTVNLFRR
jgi:hypothetical protein